MEQLTQKQTTDLRRFLTVARLRVREAWAGRGDEASAAQLEEAEKHLASMSAILGEEPGDEPQGWEGET